MSESLSQILDISAVETIELVELYSYCCGFDETHEVCRQLVVSGCDTPKLFKLVEEALDKVSLLVEIGVVGALDLALPLGADNNLRFLLFHLFNQMGCVMPFIGKKSVGLDTLDEVVSLCDVVALTGVPISRTGGPTASVAARISVVSPPRDRPRPWATALYHSH